MQLSIIIPTFNEEHYVAKLLQSLVETGIPGLDIVVVDGRSEDATRQVVADFAREHHARVAIRLVESPVRNVAHQRNLGAEHAQNDLLLFLDADVVIPSGKILERWYAAFAAQRVAVASCRFVPLSDRPVARCYFSLLYFYHRLLSYYRPWALGACIMVRKKVFIATGGFDTTISINEDADFSERAAKQGTFRLFSDAIGISVRRFEKYGYFRLGLWYVYVAFYRLLKGEIRGEIHYPFGQYDQS